MIHDGQDFFSVGIKHRTALDGEGRPRSAAAGRVFDARPFDRRLRLGDDEQGDRHDRRAGVRQGRAGVSEVRLGEEGPADDVLSDDRRLAHLFAQRAGVRRPGRAERHDGPVQRQSAGRAWSTGGAIFMQSPYTNPVDVWQRIPTRDKNTIREKQLRVFFIDMVQIAREVASEADLQMRMQGIVLLGAFLKLTPFAKASNMTDEAVYAGVEKALRKYFGKRGEQVVQDNLNCVKRGYSEMQEIPREVIHGGNGHV